MKFVLVITVATLACAVWAQNDSGLTARQLFLSAPSQPSPVPKKTGTGNVTPSGHVTPGGPVAPGGNVSPAPSPEPKLPPTVTVSRESEGYSPVLHQVSFTPLALKYSILQRKGGSFQEVDADTEFHSGDRIRVRVEANSPSYLYIVMGGSSGQWRVLFPSKEIAGGNNRIESGQPCTIPPESDPAFYFDETAGVEKVSLVLSRSPEPDLEKLIYDVGDPKRNGDPHERTILAMNHPIDRSVLGHLRDEVLSRDLVFEKYDGTTPEGKQEKAVYAATKDQSPNARLFVDLKLVHK